MDGIAPLPRRFVVARLGFLWAVLSVFVVSWFVSSAGAAATLTTGNGSSCVASIDGWAASSSLSVNFGTTYVMRWKCYYSTTPVTVPWLVGSSYVPTGANATPNCINFPVSTSSLTCFGSSASTAGYMVTGTGYVRDTVGTNYVEGHISFTRANAGSFSFPTGLAFYLEWNTTAGVTQRIGETGLAASASNYYVASSAFAAATPALRWGAAFGATACDDVTLAYSSTADVAGKGTVTVTSSQAVAGVVYGLSYRWGVGAWSAAGNVPGSFTVVNSGAQSKSLSSLAFKCVNGATGSVAYRTVPGTSWLATDPHPSACLEVTLSWPAGLKPSAASVGFSLSVPADATVTVAHTVVDQNVAPYVPVAASVWTTDLTASLGPSSPTVTVTGLKVDQPWSQLFWRCSDGSGTISSYQWSATYVLSQTSNADSSGDCYDQAMSGITLNPATLATGIVKGFGCSLMWVLVPSDSDLSSIGNDWGGTWLGRLSTPVIQTVSAMAHLGDAMYVGGYDSSACSSPTTFDFGSSDTVHGAVLGHHYVSFDPFSTCDTGGVIYYVSLLTKWLSRFAVVLLVLYRLRSLYFGLAAPGI